jgi:hypothetical protein
METWGIANSITSFATIFAGLVTLSLGSLHRHPRHWMLVYGAILLTGLPTLWYHGSNETIFAARISDIGTNLLLAWCVTWAALTDFFSTRTRAIVAVLSAASILGYLTWNLAVGMVQSRLVVLGFGAFGGFTVGELILITNSILGTLLLGLRINRAPRDSRPYYWLTVAWFLAGTLAATASNQQVDFTFMAWHALWHIIGGFGFIMLWAYADARFASRLAPQS